MTRGLVHTFDDGGLSALASMIRLFLLGMLLLGLGLGVQKGWVIFDWPKIRQDLHLNFNLPFQS
jgi:hypothetical protein